MNQNIVALIAVTSWAMGVALVGCGMANIEQPLGIFLIAAGIFTVAVAATVAIASDRAETKINEGLASTAVNHEHTALEI